MKTPTFCIWFWLHPNFLFLAIGCRIIQLVVFLFRFSVFNSTQFTRRLFLSRASDCWAVRLVPRMKPQYVGHKVWGRLLWRAVVNMLMPSSNRSHASQLWRWFKCFNIRMKSRLNAVKWCYNLWQLETIVAKLLKLSDRFGTKQTMKGLPPVWVWHII